MGKRRHKFCTSLKGDTRPERRFRFSLLLLETSFLLTEAVGNLLQWFPCQLSCCSSLHPRLFSLRIDPLWQCLKVWCWVLCGTAGIPAVPGLCLCSDIPLPGSWHQVGPSPGESRAGVLALTAAELRLSLRGGGACRFHLPEGKQAVCLCPTAFIVVSCVREHCVLNRFITLSLQ